MLHAPQVYPASFRLQLNCEKLDPHVSAEEMYARQSTQAEGFSATGSGNANAHLVTVSTILEGPGENCSTLLGVPKRGASAPEESGSESSDEDYDDAENSVHLPASERADSEESPDVPPAENTKGSSTPSKGAESTST